MDKESTLNYIDIWLLKFISGKPFILFVDSNLNMNVAHKSDVESHLYEWMEGKYGNFSLKDGGFVIEIKSGKKHSFKIERNFGGV